MCSSCGDCNCIAPNENEIQWHVSAESLMGVIEADERRAVMGMREWVRRLEYGHSDLNQDGERVDSKLRRAEEAERRVRKAEAELKSKHWRKR